MRTFTIRYNIDGYSSPLPEATLRCRARTPNNALAEALRQLSYRVGVRRGAIAEARRDGGRVFIGMAGYSRPRFAWVGGEP